MATKRFGPRGRVVGGVAVAGAGVVVAALELVGGAGLGPGSGPGTGTGVGAGQSGLAAAQGTTATATGSDQAVHFHPGRPTHVYAGGCDDLGEVTHALNPIGAGTMTGPEMADMPGMAIGDAVGSANAVPVEIGRITLAVPLAELVAERQAVNVYRSESEYGVTVACGDVGGANLDDTLAFGLREQNGSGLSGLVVFTGRGEETDVVAYLTSTSGTPAESGTAGETGDVDASDPAAESGRGDRVDRGDRASSADRASRGDRVGRGGATPTAE